MPLSRDLLVLFLNVAADFAEMGRHLLVLCGDGARTSGFLFKSM